MPTASGKSGMEIEETRTRMAVSGHGKNMTEIKAEQ